MKPKPANAADTFGATRPLGPYQCARWRGKERGQFEAWVRDRREREARKVAFRSVDERLITAAEATRILIDVRSQPLGLSDLLNELRAQDAFLYAAWLGLRQCHPELKLDQVGDINMGGTSPNDLVMWLVGLDAVAEPSEDTERRNPNDPPSPSGSSTPSSSDRSTPATPPPASSPK